MPRTKSKTPVTWESLNSVVLPQIRKIFQSEFEKVYTKIDNKHRQLEAKVELYRREVIEFKEEVVGEIQALRNEVTLTLGQYQRMDSRVTRIEKHLNLPAISQ